MHSEKTTSDTGDLGDKPLGPPGKGIACKRDCEYRFIEKYNVQ
jgi:hypothetical protein